ncbi:MAG: ATP synthase F1 subunit gamma [Planctomycetota bacterium]
MAEQTRALRARQKAVGNIQRITKTMQMIATARFQSMQKAATEAQAYSRKLAEVVGELSSASGSVDHPLLHAPEPTAGRTALLVISSNRGLCGAYNANVLRTALHTHAELAAAGTVSNELVGKKSRSFFGFNGIPVDAFHDEFGDSPNYPAVEALANRLMLEFIDGKYDAVKVVYMHFLTMSKQVPEVLQLLPIKPPAADDAGEGEAAGQTLYDFSPEPEKLLADLLPRTVRTTLFQCFNEALVSEQLSRMVAMKAATDAAGKLKKELGRRYNRARQTAITTELSEIIAGAASVA